MKVKKAPILSKEEKLSKAIAQLLKGEETVIIVDGESYYGIIDDKNIRLGLKNPDKVKCSSSAIKAPSIKRKELEEPLKIAGKFLSGHFNALPVIEDKKPNKPLGVVTRTALLGELLRRGLIPKVSCYAVMATPIYSIEGEETLGRLKRLMKELKVHKFVVTENKKIMGIISTTDLLMFMEKPKKRDSLQLITSVKNQDELKIKQFVREEFLIVNDRELLTGVVEKMAKENSPHAIVVNNYGNPIGIISSLDIFKLVLKITSPRPTLVISGIEGDDLILYEDIKEAIEKELLKISKFVYVREPTLRVKKRKTHYEIYFGVELEDEIFHIKEDSHTLEEAIRKLIKHIQKLATKAKDIHKSHKTTSEEY